MAPVKPTPNNDSSSTRPRLQAINQDFSDLDEQIRQAAHIIGLPDNWSTIHEQEARAEVIRQLVRARAEWVLRWILDKLKDETAVGKTARGNSTAWQLLDWMIHVLPVSRSAPHLRDASFPTILESTLVENFDKDSNLQSAASSDHVDMRDASESSETVHEGSTPSRKRKRGEVKTSPSKRVALGTSNRDQLFRVVRIAIQSIGTLATASNKSDDTTQAELMKMVLRTESAQASRVLRFWLTGIHQILSTISASATKSPNLDEYIDLSLALDMWDLRTVDAKDEMGASAEEFSNECLVPALTLLENLKSLRERDATQYSSIAIDRAITALDRRLARHLLAPSRAAFFADVGAESTNAGSESRNVQVLATNLEPLRAKLLQAAQIEDGGDALPTELASLFNAVPHLLDLTIRASPSRTPKGRSVEKPWLQAVFSALADCAGCSLTTPPGYITRQTAITALGCALRILQVHEVSLTSDLLKNIFWYHCGVRYPESQEKQVHWSLIASLIQLDPSVFAAEQRSGAKTSPEQHADLAEFIFEQISTAEFKGSGFSDKELTETVESKDQLGSDGKNRVGRAVILEKIIIPLMSAFVRNRNLLGFLRRWDHQLVRSYRHDNRKALQERQNLIWEDRTLNSALAELFEQSLTQGQIATLIQEHGKRMVGLGDAIETSSKEDVKVKKLAAYKNAASSAVLIPAILQSIQSDDNIEALKPDLHSLLLSYATWVHDDRYSLYSRLGLSWFTLCQLLAKLWPIELHASAKLQQKILHPLVEQAMNDMSTGRKDQNGRRVDSPTRAAAMSFLLDACDRLQTVPGSEDIVRTSLRKVTESLSSSRLEPEEHMKMVEFFCADFVALLRHLDVEACRDSLLTTISMLSNLDSSTADLTCQLLSRSIIAQENSLLHETYSTALLEALKRDDTHDMHNTIVRAILHIQPLALSREKRKSILDRTIELLKSGQGDTIGFLSVMAHLQQVPNATAKVSTDASIIFDIAEVLHTHKLETSTALQLLRQLVQLTLGHIIPNQTQAQNKEFFIDFSGKLLQVTKAIDQCSSARLSVLRATALAQKQMMLLHFERYVELLKRGLTDSQDATVLHQFLDAFNELSVPSSGQANSFDKTQTWLRTWVSENGELDSYIASPGQNPIEVAEYVARLHTTVARFKLYADTKWLIKLTLKVLQEPLAGSVQDTVYTKTREALAPLPSYEKLNLVPVLTDVQDPLDQTASSRILNDLIATMADVSEADSELKQKQLALLPRLCVLLAETSEFKGFNALLNCINTILNEKPSLASQHSVECVFSVLVKVTSRSSPALSSQHASDIFSRICETSRLVLLVHRGRLGGRFHLLLPLLQGLLFCLFIPNAIRSGALPSWLRTVTATEPVRLTPANATQFSRLLSTLCNPPQSSITKAHQHHASRKSKELNDPVKAAREKASNFLYPLLASFCRYQLNGRLDQGVREKLMPGLWEVVGTASLHREGLDAMFSGLGRSERDVWKTLWEEWEGVFGRRQVVGHGE
ncbi:hypothetical protein EJ02DRAFT_372878 [Clathrospora elynae]|uniref:Nucleolar 27S pre-rRNA processing Urb2/Npa2 C-terminal domain-containing protein n=1 Tax=Clathrospora elynae TaxID=706981 RepID=A0A6A5STB4_9PLEO|nr:hypothetical protein EJ02DRAFT_372878 [Clathrospora elynae]